ncbi:MAG: response regulator transcription factor [Dehalococcoidales bacterium]|nr:MAG: response regulator transcription factor [Dehalococcoidales bacterium]
MIQSTAKENIRILLVDDHQVVRDGLQHMLEQEDDLEVIGQGADGEETFRQIEKLRPDVILMDIKMPGIDGIELTRQVKRKFPACNVIMLTLFDQYFNQAMEAGASGYLLKDIKSKELANAIRQVYNGQIVTSSSMSQKDRFLPEAEQVHDETSNLDALEELQMIIPPPVEANQLMRLSGKVERSLKSRVLQVIGSWEEGTIMTIALDNVSTFTDILEILKSIPEVQRVSEEPPVSAISPKLFEKAKAVPKVNNRIRKAVFLTLDKNQ